MGIDQNRGGGGGGGGGALSDSGNDTDGGDDHQLPNAGDNIDLQSSGEILNAETITTENGTINGRTLESNKSLTIDSDEGFVVAGDYTVESGATLTVDGKMTVI